MEEVEEELVTVDEKQEAEKEKTNEGDEEEVCEFRKGE